jgi:hypothetical protein
MKHPHPHDIPITIDRKPFKTPSPTTGATLYTLGSVRPDYDLFRETRGPGDDEFIPNDSTSIDLKEGDHFYSVQRTLNPGATDG